MPALPKSGAWPRAGTAADHVGMHVVAARAPGTLVPTAVVPQPAAEARASVSEQVAPRDDARSRITAAVPSERQELLRNSFATTSFGFCVWAKMRRRPAMPG